MESFCHRAIAKTHIFLLKNINLDQLENISNQNLLRKPLFHSGLILRNNVNKKFVINPKQQTIENRTKYLKQSDDFDKQEIKPKSKIINDFKSALIESLEQIKKINKLNDDIMII